MKLLAQYTIYSDIISVVMSIPMDPFSSSGESPPLDVSSGAKPPVPLLTIVVFSLNE